MDLPSSYPIVEEQTCADQSQVDDRHNNAHIERVDRAETLDEDCAVC